MKTKSQINQLKNKLAEVIQRGPYNVKVLSITYNGSSNTFVVCSTNDLYAEGESYIQEIPSVAVEHMC